MTSPKDVLIFIREAMSKFDNLRTVIIERLLEVFTSIRSAKIHRAAVWILGEYCASSDDIQSVMSAVRQNLGEIPIVEDELRKAAGDEQGRHLVLRFDTSRVRLDMKSHRK